MPDATTIPGDRVRLRPRRIIFLIPTRSLDLEVSEEVLTADRVTGEIDPVPIIIWRPLHERDFDSDGRFVATLTRTRLSPRFNLRQKAAMAFGTFICSVTAFLLVHFEAFDAESEWRPAIPFLAFCAGCLSAMAADTAVEVLQIARAEAAGSYDQAARPEPSLPSTDP